MRLFNSGFAFSFVVMLCTSASATAQFTTEKYVEALQQSLTLESHLQYDDAIRLLEGSVVKCVDAGRVDWEAAIRGILGTLYQRTGKYAEAEASLNKSVAEWTRLNGPNSKDLVGPLAGLGGLYYEASQFSRAAALIERAVALQPDTGKDNHLIAMLHANLASVYFAQRKDEQATQHAEMALKKFALIPNGREGTARAYALLGAIDLRAGSMPEAKSYFEKALTLWQASYGENDPHIAEGTGDLAMYHFAVGETEKAEPLFRKSMEMFDRVRGSNAFQTELYTEYVALEKMLGHKKEAKRAENKLQQLIMTSAQNTISRDVVDVSGFRASSNSTPVEAKAAVQNPLR